MKPDDAVSKGPADDGRELESSDPERQQRDDASAAPLPREADQDPESQQEDGTRAVGEQAHRDLERGLVDTDRRGGEAYQNDTQRDERTDVNPSRKP